MSKLQMFGREIEIEDGAGVECKTNECLEP
jgi:hypothetical protein